MKLQNVLVAVASLFIIQSAMAGSDVMVSDAWVREGPPNASALGGFMVIHNHSKQAKSLVKASSDSFGKAELHRTMQADGMMKMMKQEKIEIPAKGSLTFKPGDYHIMLMKPKKSLKAGDHVTITLGFSDGSSIKVKYPVRKGEGMGMNHEHDMNQMDHMKH